MHKVFMIDPPWPISMGGKRKARGTLATELPYQTMSYEEIKSCLKNMLDPINQCCVFLWATERSLLNAESMAATLGLKMHFRLIWDKGNGFPSAFTIRPCHEYLLWFYKGKFMPIAKEWRGKLSSVFAEKSREHSRKPNIAYKIVEQLYPDLPKIDVFSREKREGWDQFGNETNKFAIQ